jgi:phage-related protein
MADVSYFWYGEKPVVNITRPTRTSVLEDFEDATYDPFFTVRPVSTMANTHYGWLRASEAGKAAAGSWSFRTNASTGHLQNARCDFVFTVPANANTSPDGEKPKFEFWFYLNGEKDDASTAIYDTLSVYVNNVLWRKYTDAGSSISQKSGTSYYAPWQQWVKETYDGTLTPGTTYTFTFSYDRDSLDGAGNFGGDVIYIDELNFTYYTGSASVTFTPGAELVRFDGTTGYSLEGYSGVHAGDNLWFIEHRSPFSSGAYVQATTFNPRDIEFKVYIKGTSESDLNDKLRMLASNLINRDGALYATYTDGTWRYMPARYMEGLEESRNAHDETAHTMRAPISFRSHDPFWYKYQGKTNTDDINSSFTCGDYDAWPIILIDGPAATVPGESVFVEIKSDSAANLTGADQLKINQGIPTGSTMEIDMKKRTVKLDGSSIYSSVDSTGRKFAPFPGYGGVYYVDVDCTNDANYNFRYFAYARIPYWGV